MKSQKSESERQIEQEREKAKQLTTTRTTARLILSAMQNSQRMSTEFARQKSLFLFLLFSSFFLLVYSLLFVVFVVLQLFDLLFCLNNYAIVMCGTTLQQSKSVNKSAIWSLILIYIYIYLFSAVFDYSNTLVVVILFRVCFRKFYLKSICLLDDFSCAAIELLFLSIFVFFCVQFSWSLKT